MKIRAAVCREKGQPFLLENLELEEPRDHEVLVRIVGVGLCHTDLVARDQEFPVPLPAVLGHEGSGVVERVGRAVTRVVPGDHVVLSFLSCGHCHPCLRGKPAYCEGMFALNFGGSRADGSLTISHGNGMRDDGQVHGSFFGQSSFATHALTHERNTVKVSRDVPLELLGPLGCGLQTGAGAVLNALKPEAGSALAVFGAGPVGMAAVMAARVAGCTTIIAVDLRAERLALARELGATHTIDPGEREPVAEIQKLTGGGAARTLEATGVPGVFRQAVDALRVTGVCGIVGTAPFGTEARLDMNSVLLGRTVRGIVEGDSVPDIFIPRLIELFRQGRFPFDRLVRFYPLGDINHAVHDSVSGHTLKAILRP